MYGNATYFLFFNFPGIVLTDLREKHPKNHKSSNRHEGAVAEVCVTARGLVVL